MASPAVAGTAEGSVNTAGTSHAVTLPGGGASTDEYLIIMDIGSTSATMNALTNWTEVLDEAVANGLKIWVYDGTGVPSNPTFTSSASTRSAWIAYRITGADKTITPGVGTTATGTNATPDPPSVTPPSSKDYLFITFFGGAGEEADDDTWVNSAPTNYTNLLQKSCGTAGTDLGGKIGAAQRQLTTGSAENPGTFSQDVSTAWRAQTIIVHPAAAAPQTISGTTAIETDVALGGTALNPFLAAGTTAAETDVALGGTVQQGSGEQTIPGTTAIETDVALGGVALNPFTAAGTTASETDAALAGAVLQAQLVVGVTAVEADVAVQGAVIAAQFVTGTTAVETNMALGGTVVQVVLRTVAGWQAGSTVLFYALALLGDAVEPRSPPLLSRQDPVWPGVFYRATDEMEQSDALVGSGVVNATGEVTVTTPGGLLLIGTDGDGRPRRVRAY